MPQMSPMVWFVFPFIMMMLVLIGVTTLNGELGENKEVGWNKESSMKWLKW